MTEDKKNNQHRSASERYRKRIEELEQIRRAAQIKATRCWNACEFSGYEDAWREYVEADRALMLYQAHPEKERSGQKKERQSKQ